MKRVSTCEKGEMAWIWGLTAAGVDDLSPWSADPILIDGKLHLIHTCESGLPPHPPGTEIVDLLQLARYDLPD